MKICSSEGFDPGFLFRDSILLFSFDSVHGVRTDLKTTCCRRHILPGAHPVTNTRYKLIKTVSQENDRE